MIKTITFKENQPFNTLSRSQKSLVFKKLTEAIDLISGEDKEDFIEYLLKSNYGKKHFIPVATKTICGPIIQNIIKLYKESPENKKASTLR